MKWSFFLYACMFVAFAIMPSCNFDTDEKYDFTNEIDRTFMLRTGISNISAIQAGLLASSKATNNSVATFAKTAIAERTVAQAQLKAIASNEFVDFMLKEEPDAANEAKLAQLDSLTGRAFDSVYIYYQLNNHDFLIENFLKEKDGGRNPDLKKYVDSNLIKVRAQRNIAEAITEKYYKR